MTTRKCVATVILLLLLPLLAFAQEQMEPVAILEYYGNDFELQVLDADGIEVTDIFYGMELLPGDTVVTEKTTAEIRLQPNGSIVKLAANTRFSVESLQGRGGAEQNSFALFTGKMRTIAASATGADNYSVRTPTAVCGVRGTDFTLEAAEGLRDAVYVLAGAVEFVNNQTGQALEVAAGQFADVFGEAFQAVELTQNVIQERLQDMGFQQLNADTVPGHEAGDPLAQAGDEAEDAVAEDEEDEADDDQEAVAEVPPEPPAEPEPAEPEEAAEAQPGPLDPVFNYLRENLGMEIGALTINGVTYSKAVIQPVINLGKLRLGLYLPIIYQQNLFDPNDWYRPAGNDEWSFGTDAAYQGDFMAQATDFAADLALKIKFLEWGEQRDKFYLKVGNLKTMTIGHGLVMRNYANDADFPAIRRIGVNTGFDFTKTGFEAVVNDLAEPEIFGGRFYLRPAAPTFNLAFGISTVADIDPAGDLPADQRDLTGNPIFLNAGLDLDLPILETDFLTFVLFGDVAGLLPYLREPITGQDAGFATAALMGPEGPRNYGFSTGAFGNLLMVDWRLEYRYFTGAFEPALYNATYDRLRGQHALRVADYLQNPDAAEYQGTTAGIYGEAGFSLFEAVHVEAGYMWPWTVTDAGVEFADEDFINLKLGIEKGVIPFADISGSISYERRTFMPALLGLTLDDGYAPTLFDGNTVMKGEIIYPVAPTLDLAILVTTTTVTNEDGTIVYENGAPKVNPSFSVETRVHF